jgi:hypothetical protein
MSGLFGNALATGTSGTVTNLTDGASLRHHRGVVQGRCLVQRFSEQGDSAGGGGEFVDFHYF